MPDWLPLIGFGLGTILGGMITAFVRRLPTTGDRKGWRTIWYVDGSVYYCEDCAQAAVKRIEKLGWRPTFKMVSKRLG
jgi:hypothetical protein